MKTAQSVQCGCAQMGSGANQLQLAAYSKDILAIISPMSTLISVRLIIA